MLLYDMFMESSPKRRKMQSDSDQEMHSESSESSDFNEDEIWGTDGPAHFASYIFACENSGQGIFASLMKLNFQGSASLKKAYQIYYDKEKNIKFSAFLASASSLFPFFRDKRKRLKASLVLWHIFRHMEHLYKLVAFFNRKDLDEHLSSIDLTETVNENVVEEKLFKCHIVQFPTSLEWTDRLEQNVEILLNRIKSSKNYFVTFYNEHLDYLLASKLLIYIDIFNV